MTAKLEGIDKLRGVYSEQLTCLQAEVTMLRQAHGDMVELCRSTEAQMLKLQHDRGRAYAQALELQAALSSVEAMEAALAAEAEARTRMQEQLTAKDAQSE